MNVIPALGQSVGSKLSFAEKSLRPRVHPRAARPVFRLEQAALAEIEAQPDRSLAVTRWSRATPRHHVALPQDVESATAGRAGHVDRGGAGRQSVAASGDAADPVTNCCSLMTKVWTFILALYKSGGWDAIQRRLSNPPTTTEQNPPS